MSSRANETDCFRFLRWPIIVIGAALMGFTGPCYRISGLLMLFVIAALFGLVVFAFALTASGSGRPQPGRAYDFYLEDY